MTRLTRLIFIALLCCWLPVQSFAALVSECHLLNDATEDVQQTPATPNQDEHRGCGEATTTDAGPAALEQLTGCYHCQWSCHSVQLLLMPPALNAVIFEPWVYLRSPFLSPKQVFLDAPQRPPQAG